jgi:hypothetical protein
MELENDLANPALESLSGESVIHGREGPLCQLSAKGRAGEDPFQREGQSALVAGRHQEAVDAIADRLQNASAARGNDWDAVMHRLQNAQVQALRKKRRRN